MRLIEPYRGERGKIASMLVEATKAGDKTLGEFAFFHFLTFGDSSTLTPPAWRRENRRGRRDNMLRASTFDSSPLSYVVGLDIFRRSFRWDEARIETLQKAFAENIDFIIEEALREDQARSAELALTE